MEDATDVRSAQEIHEGKDAASHVEHNSSYSLIVVGTETAVFDKTSDVRARILAYTEAFSRVDIVVMCGRGYAEETIGSVRLIPTNSSSRISRVFDAIRIGRALPIADIVTVQDPFETGLAGYFIAKELKAPLHVQVHTDFLSPAFQSLSPINGIRTLIARFVLMRASGIRVVSAWIKNSITAQYHLAGNVSVLPIFVDVPKFQNAVASPELVAKFSAFATRLLVVSRLEAEKNVELAIRAFEFSAPKDACLIIVGEGSRHTALYARAQRSPAAERIFFEGRQNPAPYYKIASLVLAPSLYEGYGMVIVEALAAGVPVLSADVGVAREAGAVITTHQDFAHGLAEWFERGPKEGKLRNYPYQSFDEYVQAYGKDITGVLESPIVR